MTPEEQEEQEAERRESIRLSQESAPPLACQSYGRALVQPFVTRQTEDEEYVAWPTDRGYLFVGYIARLENHFTIRLPAGDRSGDCRAADLYACESERPARQRGDLRGLAGRLRARRLGADGRPVVAILGGRADPRAAGGDRARAFTW